MVVLIIIGQWSENIKATYVKHKFGYKLLQSSRAMPPSNLSNTHELLMRFPQEKCFPLTGMDSARIIDNKEFSHSVRRNDGRLVPCLSVSDSNSLKSPTKSQGKSTMLFI